MLNGLIKYTDAITTVSKCVKKSEGYAKEKGGEKAEHFFKCELEVLRGVEKNIKQWSANASEIVNYSVDSIKKVSDNKSHFDYDRETYM